MVLLVVVPFVVFLLLAEVGLRFYLSRHTFYDVEMSRYARLLKIDSSNPLVEHVHRPGGRAHLMNVDVRINSAGFRDDEYDLERNRKRRLIFLGDSLTFGWGVEKHQSFEHRIEAQLNERTPTEIINFGSGNYNTVQEAHLFLDAGLGYSPDQVVLFYFINDAEPIPQKSRFPWLGNIRIVTFYWSRVKALVAGLTGSGDYRDYYSALYREGAPGWQNAKQALLLLKNACQERGIAFQVVLLPELHELVDYAFAEEHRRVGDFLRRHDIDFLDLAPFFASEHDPQSLWVAADDAHPNAEAHRRIAEYSVDFIAGATGR